MPIIQPNSIFSTRPYPLTKLVREPIPNNPNKKIVDFSIRRDLEAVSKVLNSRNIAEARLQSSEAEKVQLLVQLLEALEKALRTNYVPAVAALKQNPYDGAGEQVIQKLEEFFADKGFDPKAGLFLAERGLLGSLFHRLVLRIDSLEDIPDDLLFRVLLKRSIDPSLLKPKYSGTAKENVEIDRSIKESTHKNNSRRQLAGIGATRIFNPGSLLFEQPGIRTLTRNTKVVVIGGGPAGLMVTRGLVELGFNPQNITVLDKSGEYGGIWNKKIVYEGSKNNPFHFNFLGLTLSAAPGSGRTVNDFLTSIEDRENRRFSRNLPKPIKAIVLGVNPGDLNHTVIYKTPEGEKSITAPIVINALGNGRPLNPNREGYMTTGTPDKAGIRWQKIITPELAEKYRGKTLVFIGLGNSTAEMLIQLRDLNQRGYNIDYRVITHYPQKSVEEPTEEFEIAGKKYKVFRDITIPNLTKWEGDLPDAKDVYYRALSQDKIISDVVHWDVGDGKFTAVTKSGEVKTFNCAELFTLIGYGHDPDILRAMGMTVTDEYAGTIAHDHDGEIQKNPGTLGRGRVCPGYFGLGAILKSSENPNAVVMPGIMHRMYDLLFSAVIRAAEYELRK